ncbi:response regulator transcription factor [Oceanihabitans sp. IOP_32]|uniref:response regulator n=1 Tax=Oceanihabitans sp. IOP_32 TaxID=2529032 RepID=UPI001292FFD8|nr:response regulator transcription factor [Oceanihabitans sp. IOP_32]QFZ53789.1 response regulator transcription factor [Oceanihabitans sp. IOP_32]
MIKLLIADSHPIIRKGLEHLFSVSSDIKIVGSVANGTEILDFIKHHEVDILLTEINLPKMNGLTVLRHLKKDHPELKTLIFSSEPEEVYGINAIKAGASGFVSKSVNIITINDAILRVHQGGIYLSDALTQQLAQSAKSNKSGSYYKKLSTRESEVLKLLSIGKKNKEIAKELNINEKTVSTYKARLMRKLKVDNLIDLVNQAKISLES